MKLTNDQFEASAYIFEKANGNKKSEYEEQVIAESGLNNLKPIELETRIVNGIDNGLYSDSKERISAYWSLSKIHKTELIPNFKKWLKIELENENADTVYQLMIALGNLGEPIFNIDRNGSSAFNETELNLRDARKYLETNE
ncbi:hypothetical protein [Cochleicola gelatinilyticus]|uniref:Uncharacterized protein n=1 Tax=Cochleicola gelatinilyticus TaxID=1763537 RepID=A0A167HWI0_9FLAO|nr:hypothetical protein [Cochleicola gelatinilyticus]OAB79044.1 hypothetical protein ULVI_07675 [Cochleicola gelatinilyticus]